jgi:hypothetical protein
MIKGTLWRYSLMLKRSAGSTQIVGGVTVGKDATNSKKEFNIKVKLGKDYFFFLGYMTNQFIP